MPEVEVGSLAVAGGRRNCRESCHLPAHLHDEERQPFSLDAQQERLAAYVGAQPGWVLTCSYSDRMSGKRLDRPGLQQALHDARTGRYDLLLVFKVDRLARSTGGLAKVLEELDAGGVAFRSASEPFDTSTAAGRMMMQMLGVFAEFEREMIVERTRMGLTRKAARGEWTGGTPPFGYRYDAESQVLIPVPVQAALVQRIFTLYHAVCRSSAGLSRHQRTVERHRAAHQTGTPVDAQPRPGRATQPHLHRTAAVQWRTAPGQPRAPHRPRAVRAGTAPAHRALGFSSRPSRQRHRLPADRLPALPALWSRLCRNGRAWQRRHYRYYICFSRQRHGTARCDQERLPAGQLEEAILNETLAALDDGSIFEAAGLRAEQAWHAQHPGRQAELAGTRAALGERRAVIDRYLRAFEAGRLPESTCADRLTELDQEVRALEARMAALEAECETTPAMATRDVLMGVRRRVERAVADGAPEQLKRLLDTVVDQILVESRAYIQPYFVAPAVRTRIGQRRRTGIEPA
jgi:site-specific DNA recombinase